MENVNNEHKLLKIIYLEEVSLLISITKHLYRVLS
jgi:hypothetical protein